MEPDNTGVETDSTQNEVEQPNTHDSSVEDEPTGAEAEEPTGVDAGWPTGVEDDHGSSDEESDDKGSRHDGENPPINQEMDKRYSARTHQHDLRVQQPRSYAHR